MASPFISVVIPTYNASKFLREALDSLLSQTFTDWEALCVNDGSTDDSLAIMQEYAAKDSRFRILDGPNGGYGKAMNRGLDAAHGVYTSILEPDDFTPRRAYEMLAAAAQQHDADIVRGEACYFYESEDGTKKHYCRRMNPKWHRVFKPREETDFFFSVQHTWCCLYRLSFIRERGIRYNETPGASYQDTGWFFLTAAFAERVVCLPNITYCYRTDNPNSSMHNRSRKGNVLMDEFAFIRAKLEAGDLWTPIIRPLFLRRYLIANLWLLQQLADDLRPAFLERIIPELRELSSIGLNTLPPEQRQEAAALLRGAAAYEAHCRQKEESGCRKIRRHGLTHLTEDEGRHRCILCCGLPIYRCRIEPKTSRHYFLGLPLLKRIAQPVYSDYEHDFRYICANSQTFYVLGIPIYSRVTNTKEFRF